MQQHSFRSLAPSKDDKSEFTDHAREATASDPWEVEPSSSVVCSVPETPADTPLAVKLLQ